MAPGPIGNGWTLGNTNFTFLCKQIHIFSAPKCYCYKKESFDSFPGHFAIYIKGGQHKLTANLEKKS